MLMGSDCIFTSLMFNVGFWPAFYTPYSPFLLSGSFFNFFLQMELTLIIINKILRGGVSFIPNIVYLEAITVYFVVDATLLCGK